MKIKFAKYNQNGETVLIKASQIPSVKAYERDYKNHLFCSEEGCNAKIELAHRGEYAYFRTWKHSSHSEGCYYSFMNSPQNNPQKDGRTVLTSISEPHKKSALKNSNNKRKEDEGLKVKRSKVNRNTDKNKPSTNPIRLVPSVDPTAAIVSKAKEPRIPTRTCDDILPKDIDSTITVRGYVSKALVDEESVVFLFDTTSGEEVRILFYNRFKDNSKQAFEYISSFGAYINDNHTVFISCIGLVQKNSSNIISIQVMESIDITINDKPLPKFVRIA